MLSYSHDFVTNKAPQEKLMVQVLVFLKTPLIVSWNRGSIQGKKVGKEVGKIFNR